MFDMLLNQTNSNMPRNMKKNSETFRLIQTLSSTKQDNRNPFSRHLFPYFLLVSSLKLFPLSYAQKSLMKPDIIVIIIVSRYQQEYF